MAGNYIFYSLTTLLFAVIIEISYGQSTFSSYFSPLPQSSPAPCSLNCGIYGRCVFDNCPTNVLSCCVCNRGYVGDSCNSPATVQVDIKMKCDQLEFSDKLNDINSRESKDTEKRMCKVLFDALKSSKVKCSARSFVRGCVIGALVLQSDDAQALNANSVVNIVKNFCETDDGCKKLGVDTNSLSATNTSVEVNNSNSTTISSSIITTTTTPTICTLKCQNNGICSTSCPDGNQCCSCKERYVGELCDTSATKQVVLNLIFTDMGFKDDMNNANSDNFKSCNNKGCKIINRGMMRRLSNARFFCRVNKLSSGSVIMDSVVQGNNDLNANALVQGIKDYCADGTNTCPGLNLTGISAIESTLPSSDSPITIVFSIWLMIINFIIMVVIY